MVGFRENEEKNCNFNVSLFKVSQSDRANFAMDIIP